MLLVQICEHTAGLSSSHSLISERERDACVYRCVQEREREREREGGGGERGERDRERERERERERKRGRESC